MQPAFHLLEAVGRTAGALAPEGPRHRCAGGMQRLMNGDDSFTVFD
jgi:hypothetical protein